MTDFASLKNQRLVITGADSGIGRQFLTEALAAGATCVAVVRDNEAIEQLSGTLAAEHCFTADFSVPGMASNATRSAITELGGKVDGLVNCAGIFDYRAGLETGLREWRQTMDINLTGTFEAARECGRAMKERGRGAMVLVSSQIGLIGHAKAAAYAASKAGVNGLTHALAIELAAHQIRVNAVAPGPIATPMTAEARKDEVRAEKLIESVPLGRFGKPEEVSAVIRFLLSDAAAFITGQVLCVDGGVTASSR